MVCRLGGDKMLVVRELDLKLVFCEIRGRGIGEM